MWGPLPTFFVSIALGRLARQHVKDALEDVVVAELDGIGFDLVELRRGGTKNRPLIELRVDRRDGNSVTVDDCARVSRVVEAKLDVSGLVAPQYELQVSSPGERPLRTVADWRRFTGRWANVLSPDHGGRFEGRILAVEGDSNAEVAVIAIRPGDERRVPLADIKEARLAFHL